jgi:acyl carrier protein
MSSDPEESHLVERAEIFDRLAKQLAELLELEAGDITEKKTLVGDLDADSLDVLELVLVLKDEFGIAVWDGEVKQLLWELGRFLPELGIADRDDVTDEEMALIAERLSVGTIVDFVASRLEVDSVAG